MITDSSLKILKIQARATYPVRQLVLRPGRPKKECVFPGDTEDSTLHLGAYLDHQLAGVASYVRNQHPEFSGDVQYQLRGMAVIPEFRGMNVGAELLLTGQEELLKDHREVLLWFNARESAVDFYRKFNYTTFGEPFMIPHVCMHTVMFKALE